MFDFLTPNVLYTVIVTGVLSGFGILKYISKFILKVPITKVRKIFNVLKELLDVFDEAQKAVDPNGDGGGDVTKDEWNKIYPEGRQLVKAIGELRKTF